MRRVLWWSAVVCGGLRWSAVFRPTVLIGKCNVHAAKIGLREGNVFACVFPNSPAWALFYSHTCDYLHRMSYLTGS